MPSHAPRVPSRDRRLHSAAGVCVPRSPGAFTRSWGGTRECGESSRDHGECRFEKGAHWLTQEARAEPYQTSKQNVSKHLKAIFAEGELEQKAVVNHPSTTALDGKDYQARHYHLAAVLAAGHRVRSPSCCR